jgi:hypothetical protein
VPVAVLPDVPVVPLGYVELGGVVDVGGGAVLELGLGALDGELVELDSVRMIASFRTKLPRDDDVADPDALVLPLVPAVLDVLPSCCRQPVIVTFSLLLLLL